MKKFLVIFLSLIIILSVIDVPIVSASGAGGVIYGPSTLTSGQTATFSVQARFVDCTGCNVSAKGRSGLSGTASGTWDSSISGVNCDGEITFNVSLKATNTGSTSITGVINLFFEYFYRDANNEKRFDYVSKNFNVTILPASSSTPTPAPAPAPGGTSNPAPAATPKPTARPTATPTPNPNAPLNWNQAEYVINNCEKDELSFKMRSSKTEITDDVLNLLREQKKKLTVDFGDFSCVLDGKYMDELPEGTDELDLGFSTKKNKTISGLTYGYDVMQLHFEKFGDLPCPITYSFHPEGYDAGDKLYLYYFAEYTQELKALQRSTVDKNGNVSFTLSHFSSYVICDRIIMDAGDYDIFLRTPTPTPSPVPSPSPTPTPTPQPTPTASPTPRPTYTLVKITPEYSYTPVPSSDESTKNPAAGGMSTWAYILLFAGVFLTIGVIIILVYYLTKK